VRRWPRPGLLDVAAHVLFRVELRLLRQVADLDTRLRPGLASISVSMPAMMRSSVDLPAPLRPRTPILAPGKNDREISRRIFFRFGGTTLPTRFMV
jgi:hypothetical protein